MREDQRAFRRDRCGAADSGQDGAGVAVFPLIGAGEDGAKDAFLPPCVAGLECAVGGEAGELGAGAGAAGGAVVGFAGAEDEVAAVVCGLKCGAEDFDVIDFGSVGSGDALLAECIADGPGEGGQRIDLVNIQDWVGSGGGEDEGVVLDEEEPVAAPCNFAGDGSVAGDFDGDAGAVAVGRDVAEGYLAVRAEFGFNYPYRGFDAVDAGLDLADVREGDDDADGPVAAHAEVACVVEEDDAGDAGGVAGLEEVGADEDVGAARLAEDGAAEVVVARANDFKAFGDGAGTKIHGEGKHAAGRFAGGV